MTKNIKKPANAGEFLVAAKGLYIPTHFIRGPLSTRKTRTSFYSFSSTIVSDPGVLIHRDYTKTKTGTRPVLI